MSAVFDQEAELAVLNIILNSPEIIFELPSLKQFMFSSSTNTLIYSTMLELVEKNFLPDYSLVVSNLSSNSKLKDAGGEEYIKYLKNLVYRVDNLKEYERQVVDNYKSRTMLSSLTEVTSKISKGEPVSTIISDFRRRLDDLESVSGGEQVVDLKVASDETLREIVTRAENPGLRGITTGYHDVDIITGGYNPGELWVVAGRPGMGKSTDMCNSAMSVAETGNPVLMYSLEMPRNSLVERMIAMKSGIPLSDIRLGNLTSKEIEKIKVEIQNIKKLPIYIDSNFGSNEDYFSITTRKYHTLKDIRVVFFDYIQLASERGSNQTAEIGSFSRTAKLLATSLGITTVVYSQLNRLVELRDDKRPILSDLRQSGSLEEDADIAMFLYRDEKYYPETTKSRGILEKIFRKQRNGPTGSIYHHFDENILRIYE